MAKTKGKNPVDINQRIALGDGLDVYYDGVEIRLTSANVFTDEMSHINLDAPTFEQLVRFAKERVGGEFAAVVVQVGKED